MEKGIINEEQVKTILNKILSEETSKVSRYEFSKVQFKIDELQSSLNETVKELRKLEDSIPYGLKGITNGRIKSLNSYLLNSQKVIIQLKDKVKSHKRNSFSQQVDEKKK